MGDDLGKLIVNVYAHRGLHSTTVFENTLEAFRRAAGAGFGIETDLRLDSQGNLLLFHDRCVGEVPVDNLSLDEIRREAGRDVPTLDDLLAADLGVPLNLEIKTWSAARALQPILAIGLPQDTLISSFIHEAVEDVSDGFDIRCAYLMASAPGERWPFEASRQRLRTIVWDYNVASDSILTRSLSMGFRNVVYGPRSAEEHLGLKRSGCDAVITDFPHLAAR